MTTRWMRYEIRPEETLASIAQDFGLDAPLLAHYNKEEANDGIEIRIPLLWRMCPMGLLYPLKKGESLCHAAARFGMTVAQLCESNPLVDPYDVVSGQVLIVRNKGLHAQ